MNTPIKRKAAGCGGVAALKTTSYEVKYKPRSGLCQPMSEHFAPSPLCVWIPAPMAATHAVKEGELCL